MTIAIGQSAYTSSATSVSFLETSAVTTQATSSSFYIALFYVTSGAPTSIGDTFSNTYAPVTAEIQNPSDGGYMRVYQCNNGAGGSGHRAAVTWTPTQIGVLIFVEVTGGVATSILDQQNCVYDNGGSPFSCLLPTTANAPDLLLGFIIVQSPNTSEAFSSPTLTNTVLTFNFSNTSLLAGAALSARVTGTGAYDASISDTAGYSKALLAMLALKEAGGAPTISSPTPSGTLGTATTATLGCTSTASAGTIYGVVDTAGNISAITAAQVVAGQNNSSTTAAFSANAAVSTLAPSVGIAGLAANTTYSYALAQANSGNSNVVTGTFTTAAIVAPPVSNTVIFMGSYPY